MKMRSENHLLPGQLKRAHMVFLNTPLMCSISFPQFAQFNARYQDFEGWYAFFWGKDIA